MLQHTKSEVVNLVSLDHPLQIIDSDDFLQAPLQNSNFIFRTRTSCCDDVDDNDCETARALTNSSDVRLVVVVSRFLPDNMDVSRYVDAVPGGGGAGVPGGVCVCVWRGCRECVCVCVFGGGGMCVVCARVYGVCVLCML